MANGKLDPNFIAAPFYGESSYDPIQEMKQAKATLSQVAFQRRKQQEAEMQKGLERFDEVDIKSWEDQQGFDEISNELNELRSQWIDVSTKGMNLVRPENIGEQKLAKAFNQKLLEIKQKNDVWQRNKAAVDEYKKILDVQKQKNINDQTVDWAESAKKLDEYFTDKGSIMERSKKLQNLLINKFQMADLGKFYGDIFNNLIKGTDVRPEDISFDPATGKTTISHRTYTSDKRINAAINKAAYMGLNSREDIKISTQKAYEVDKQEGETLEDFIRRRFLPEYATQIRTTTKGGEKGGMSINFLGRQVTMKAGMQRKDPLPYGDRTYQAPWEFDSKNAFRIPIGAKGSTIFTGSSWEPYEGGGDVEGNLLFYDSNRDEFVFRTTQAGLAPYTMNNMTIAVPRKNLGDRVDELPVEVDGVVKKFVEVFGPSEVKYKSFMGIDLRTPEKTPTVEKKTLGGMEINSSNPMYNREKQNK